MHLILKHAIIRFVLKRFAGLIKKTLRKFEWLALKNEIDVTDVRALQFVRKSHQSRGIFWR